MEPGGTLPDEERLSLLLGAQGRNEEGVLLVAEGTGGELSGSASIFPQGVPFARQARPGESELRLLAVLSVARKRGLGGALLEEGASIAAARGVDRLVLDTARANLRSQRLYLRLGYEHRPERDVDREPPKVPLSVFTLDLIQSADSESPVTVRGTGIDQSHSVAASR